MDKTKQLTCLKNAVKINKLRIIDLYDGIEYCNSKELVDTTCQLLSKFNQSSASAKHAINFSPLISDTDKIVKLTNLIDGLNKTFNTFEGRKMAHEYACMTKDCILQTLDIAISAYDRAIVECCNKL